MGQFKNIRFKNAVLVIFTTLFLLPFIFLTDFYPFLRFGMFAEPVKPMAQSEKFRVVYLLKNGRLKVWDFKNSGIQTASGYLMRNYYYRKEPEVFLKKMNLMANNKNIKEWRLLKLLDEKKMPEIVARYKP